MSLYILLLGTCISSCSRRLRNTPRTPPPPSTVVAEHRFVSPLLSLSAGLSPVLHATLSARSPIPPPTCPPSNLSPSSALLCWPFHSPLLTFPPPSDLIGHFNTPPLTFYFPHLTFHTFPLHLSLQSCAVPLLSLLLSTLPLTPLTPPTATRYATSPPGTQWGLKVTMVWQRSTNTRLDTRHLGCGWPGHQDGRHQVVFWPQSCDCGLSPCACRVLTMKDA